MNHTRPTKTLGQHPGAQAELLRRMAARDREHKTKALGLPSLNRRARFWQFLRSALNVK